MAPGPYTLNSCRWDSWLLDHTPYTLNPAGGTRGSWTWPCVTWPASGSAWPLCAGLSASTRDTTGRYGHGAQGAGYGVSGASGPGSRVQGGWGIRSRVQGVRGTGYRVPGASGPGYRVSVGPECRWGLGRVQEGVLYAGSEGCSSTRAPLGDGGGGEDWRRECCMWQVRGAAALRLAGAGGGWGGGRRGGSSGHDSLYYIWFVCIYPKTPSNHILNLTFNS